MHATLVFFFFFFFLNLVSFLGFHLIFFFFAD